MLKQKISELFSKHFLALSIIFIGVILRLFFIHFQGLSNDELSSLMRSHFPNIQTLIFEGVRKGDMHPALYQVLMWFWIKLVGESELGIRSISLLFYLVNMGLLYALACKHFSKNQGILILVIYTSFTFLIVNTTFSRPYNSGTFFLLLLAYASLNYQKSSTNISSSLIGIVVGFTGAMYSHYFAFLTAGVFGFCAFFYLDNSKKVYLLFASFVAFLFFLPHLDITLEQLGNGGLGWLAKPNKAWLLDFFIAFFNHSFLLFLLVALFMGFLYVKFPSEFTKEQRLFASVFVLAYLSGHLLSLYYTPVLRDLVMLFLLPFLFLVILKPFAKLSEGLTKKIAVIFFLFFITHTISFGGLFKPKNFAVFRELGVLGTYFETKYGKKNISYISSFNHIDYINYYRKNKLLEQQKEWNEASFYHLFQRVKEAKTPYFVYQYSNHFHSVLLYELIRRVYPNVLFHKTFFNSGFTLFSKTGKSKQQLVKTQIIASSEQEVEQVAEFFGDYTVSVERLKKYVEKSAYFTIETEGIISSDNPFYLVAVLEHQGEMLKDTPLREMYVALNQTKIIQRNKKERMLLAFELPLEAKEDDEIHFYFWNPGKTNVKVKNPSWHVVETNFDSE